MFITGLGTATPANRFTQQECRQFAQTSEHIQRLNPRSQAIVKKVLRANNGIESRFLAVDSLDEAFALTPDALHARFIQHAPAVATLAAGRAGRVLSICVEICSAAFYLDDDPGVLISACLFGDGAGAAVLTSTPSPAGRRVAWRDSSSLLDPGLRD